MSRAIFDKNAKNPFLTKGQAAHIIVYIPEVYKVVPYLFYLLAIYRILPDDSSLLVCELVSELVRYTNCWARSNFTCLTRPYPLLDLRRRRRSS